MGLFSLLNYWILMDTGERAVIVFSCLPNRESISQTSGCTEGLDLNQLVREQSKKTHDIRHMTCRHMTLSNSKFNEILQVQAPRQCAIAIQSKLGGCSGTMASVFPCWYWKASIEETRSTPRTVYIRLTHPLSNEVDAVMCTHVWLLERCPFYVLSFCGYH